MTGSELDRAAAAATVVERARRVRPRRAVALPLATTEPEVQRDDLARGCRRRRARRSRRPIRLAYGETRWRVPRWRIAPLLLAARAAARPTSRSRGRGAEEYLERLSRTRLAQAAGRARFQVTAAGKIVIRPSAPGAPARRPGDRQGDRGGGVLGRHSGRRSSSSASPSPSGRPRSRRRWASPSVVSSYTTTYGGTPGRLNNVQLVAQLIDGTLIAPGGTFSFNGTTGERTAAKGFQEAPVIINGELQNGLGGGICQVSTTVFNAAFEAGLPITARTNHALYISHYPLGRDATVNYPDLDLKFVERHGHWLLLRTFVGAGSLTVNLYGTPVEPARREHDGTARRDRARAGEGDGRSDAREGQAGDGRVRLAAARDERAAPRLRRRREAPLRQHVAFVYVGEPSLVRVGTKEPPKKPVKPKKPKSGRSDDDDADGPAVTTPVRRTTDGHDSRSAVAIASTNHGGTRVGCRVAASTVAWSVSAVATSSPVPLDPVLVAEARAADVDAAQVDREDVVEDGRGRDSRR